MANFGCEMCPRCRQNAPIVYHGVSAYCTACGAPRVPLASSSVTLAGQPSKVGGTVARVFGWIVLFGGLTVSLLLGVLFFALFPEAIAWLVVSGPIALLSVSFAWLLLRSGRGLQELGEGEQKNARTKAIFALAQNRGGMVTAFDVAQALGIRAEEADLLLTQLAKTIPDQVSLEVDDAGGVYFRFPRMLAPWQGHAVRVDASVAQPRVAAPPEREAEVVPADAAIPPGAAKRA
jgi:hypothetical protein